MSKKETHEPEPFHSWNARFNAWLASLPDSDPILQKDEIQQCIAFSKQDGKRRKPSRSAPEVKQ